MIIFRAFWALFLAGFVAYAFHRTWKWEHGSPMPENIFGGDKPRTKETAVWRDPSFLPLLLLVILIMFGAMDGMDGVERFLSLSLDVMIVISVYFLLLIFLFFADTSAREPALPCGYCLCSCSGRHTSCSRMRPHHLWSFTFLRTFLKSCCWCGSLASSLYLQESLFPIFCSDTE